MIMALNSQPIRLKNNLKNFITDHATTLDVGIMVKLVRVISLFTRMAIITSP